MTVPEEEIVGFSEVPREGGWSLRSALVRLAQPEPRRAEAVLQIVRRLDAALKPHEKTPQDAGPLLGLVEQMAELAEILAAWADRGPANPPLDQVDRICAVAIAAMEANQIPAETDRRR